jgi:DNA-binding PadR family transcriptional regulator
MRNPMFNEMRGHGGRRAFGPGFGPGGPGFGPGGPGFGPGGPGFGPGGPGFGPGGPGPWHRGHGGRGRRGRGNVRAAILALLAEEPRHGYAVMTELSARSGGLWRPSPGSVYPVLQQLQDEGLVASRDSEGRKVFELTDAGRRYVEEHAEELQEPWQVADHGPRTRVQSLMRATAGLGAAVEQVARHGDDEQAAKALAVLEDARRAMYRILAGDATSYPPEPGVQPGTEPQA